MREHVVIWDPLLFVSAFANVSLHSAVDCSDVTQAIAAYVVKDTLRNCASECDLLRKRLVMHGYDRVRTDRLTAQTVLCIVLLIRLRHLSELGPTEFLPLSLFFSDSSLGSRKSLLLCSRLRPRPSSSGHLQTTLGWHGSVCCIIIIYMCGFTCVLVCHHHHHHVWVDVCPCVLVSCVGVCVVLKCWYAVCVRSVCVGVIKCVGVSIHVGLHM